MEMGGGGGGVEVGMDGYAKKIGNTKVWRGWA